MADPEHSTEPPDAPDPLQACEEALGHRFRDPGLLRLALTHSSAKVAGLPSNERLEFLGDSVLGLLVSEHLYRTRPDAAEGDLTRSKSALVSSRTLAQVGRALAVHRFLTVGKGIRSARALPRSVRANAVEAILGAIFLDGGIEAARAAVARILADGGTGASPGERNWKAELQHLAQTAHGATPTYRVIVEEGAPHSRSFVVVARIGEREFAPARGRSKKAAEQAAARRALEALGGDVPL
ncbi:MAG: ribonuclease III [Planctomycetales bacterium]|nr:ribonuclease III [Planctomycetales bacterium]